MNIYDVYPRAWLRPDDLEPGKAYRRRILSIALRDGHRGPRLVMSLDPPIGGFSDVFLNRTSAWAIAGAYGPESDGWIGKDILIYRRRFGGKEGLMVVPAPPRPPRNQEEEA